MDNILSMIGLARRARKLACGMRLCEDMIKRGKAELVIISTDASASAKKSIKDCCAYYDTEYIEHSTKNDMGRAVGMAECAAVGVTDKSFAIGIKKKFM